MSILQAARLPKRHRNIAGQHLAAALTGHAARARPLLGIRDPVSLECLVKQLLDSIRRVEFVKRLATQHHDSTVANPDSVSFDPLKAAVIQSRRGNVDDAVWLVFLSVHFGKHATDDWALVRQIYGRVGEPGLWDWQRVSADLVGFKQWLADQNSILRQCRFSNHRKYESLDAFSRNGTGSVIESFVNWIIASGSLDQLIRAIHHRVGQNPTEVFNVLYKDMRQVHRFGRLAKFDFLTLLGKLSIAPIAPGSAYVSDNATGPYRGVCLLVSGSRSGAITRAQADAIYIELGEALKVGMQELEDGLCNWQKSPTTYRYFRG